MSRFSQLTYLNNMNKGTNKGCSSLCENTFNINLGFTNCQSHRESHQLYWLGHQFTCLCFGGRRQGSLKGSLETVPMSLVISEDLCEYHTDSVALWTSHIALAWLSLGMLLCTLSNKKRHPFFTLSPARRIAETIHIVESPRWQAASIILLPGNYHGHYLSSEDAIPKAQVMLGRGQEFPPKEQPESGKGTLHLHMCEWVQGTPLRIARAEV